jgi:hypothetical protein
MIPIQLRHFITNIIDGIYSDEQYLGINVNPQLSRKAAVDVIQYVANMRNLDTNFRKTVM